MPSLQPFQRELYRDTSECFSQRSGVKSPTTGGQNGTLSSERRQIYINRKKLKEDYGMPQKMNSLETPKVAEELTNTRQPQAQHPFTPNANTILQSNVHACPQLNIELQLPAKRNRDDFLLLSKHPAQQPPHHASQLLKRRQVLQSRASKIKLNKLLQLDKYNIA